MQVLLTKDEYDKLVRAATPPPVVRPFFSVNKVMPLESVKESYVRTVLLENGNNYAKVARLLGIHRHTVMAYANK